ncbi:MAG: thioredoxin 1 [Thermoproteota archaeon]|nr:thioredoxin 1 [Thermoproteota archaeon]
MIVFLIVLSILGGSLLYIQFNYEQNASLVNWLTDYDNGISKAKAEGKVVLIDFYADWCSWCKTLDRETYEKGDVVAYLNDKLICIRINVDENIHISNYYNITALPTIVFLSAESVEVDRIIGFLPSEQFLVRVGDILSKYSSSS